ncbi:MAG: HAD family phosphatase [Bacteroides sp.]|nr:HAD family phosphatase [Bacteroides sp.]MDE6424128.1 HAD family phosphatase [Muribaculaceae bacterium]
MKNIIFDLGGVVIDLDRQRAADALEALGITDAPALLGEYEQKGPFLLLENGNSTTADFYDNMLPRCRKDTTCTEIRDAFERFLVEIPMERLQAIRSLREKGFRLYVLSNTNPLMFNHWIDMAFRQEGLTMNDYFDGIVTSYQEKRCKPDPEIFQNVINRYKLDPKETLMLDDSAKNCESARSVGLNAIQIDNNGADSLLAVCKRLGEEGVA